MVEQHPNNPSVGINLNVIGASEPGLQTVDLFKQADPWRHRSIESESQLDLDEYGWLKTFPDLGEESQTLTTRIANQTDLVPGKYIIDWEGEGELWAIAGDNAANSPAPNWMELYVDPNTMGEQGILLGIKSTDPNNNGNYIRNIRVYHEDDKEKLDRGEIFKPEFLDKVGDFRTLRFMDWLDVNGSTQKEWNAAEQSMQQASWSAKQGAVPYEAIITLANQAKADLWINIPHQANDDYVRQAAQYIKNNLDPSLRVYVEYSNEYWNTFFDEFTQNEYMINQGKTLFGSDASNPADQYYGMRTAEISWMFSDVFGEDSSQLFPVLSSIYQTEDKLNDLINVPAAIALGRTTPANSPIKVLTTDTYISVDTTIPSVQTSIQQWQTEGTAGENKLINALLTGTEWLPDNSGNTANIQIANRSREWSRLKELADNYGWGFNSYEGGTHFAFGETSETNDFFSSLNKNPNTYALYQKLFETWQNAGGEMLIHYADFGADSKYGNWGIWDSVYDTEPNARGAAIIDQNNSAPWYSDPRSGETFIDQRLRGQTFLIPPSTNSFTDSPIASAAIYEGNDIAQWEQQQVPQWNPSWNQKWNQPWEQAPNQNILVTTDQAGQAIGIEGSAYDDTISGSTTNNHIQGLAGNDTLFGLFGDDVLDGGSGNDRLEGGIGWDWLMGGAGSDTFVLSPYSFDTIEDFNPAEDKIDVSLLAEHLNYSDAWQALGRADQQGNNTVFYFSEKKETTLIHQEVRADMLSVDIFFPFY